jgi:hypothetical protein
MDTSWRKNYFRYKSFFLNMLSQYKERSDWKAYLEILLSLATISIFSIFALKPTIITIAGLIKQIDEKKQTLQRMDSKIQNLSKAQLLYDQERGNITLLQDTVIPESAKADIFARQMEGLSTKHGARISTFNLGKATILGATNMNNDTASPTQEGTLPEGAAAINFSISVNSAIDQYSLLTAFMQDFTNLRRPPKIDTVEIKSGLSQDRKSNEILLTISGKLPYLP